MNPSQPFTLDGRRVRYLPAAAADAPLLLAFLETADSAAFAKRLMPSEKRPNGPADTPFSDGIGAHVFIIEERDWGGSFTPYPAPAAFKNAPAFGGGAAAYADRLFRSWLPECERRFALQPRSRALAGYSLGGLFAVYAAYRADSPFQRYASVSGSLWYDGWTEKMAAQALPQLPEAAYFSLGEREKNSRNRRLAAVETRTLTAAANWRQQGVRTVFEYNRGGHFDDVAERMHRAAAALLPL